MKILTWNINGIRASKRCLKDVLDTLDADVICLQETKITRDMLDEPSAIVEGYNAYFSFSRKRSGYSGTANFCRDEATPVGAEEGLSGNLAVQSEGSVGCLGKVDEVEAAELQSLDAEGRAVITQHQIELKEGDVRDLAIINVYVPRAADSDERWIYKLHFLALLQSRAESLLRSGRHVIVLGDINTTHKRIDHCDPTTQEFLRTDSRQWMDQFLRPEDRDRDLSSIDDKDSFEATLSDAEGGHFIDTFRFFYPDQTEAYTNWSTVTSARQTNYGKRLDYILIDTGLHDYLVDCQIMSDFEGSDHCPMVLELRCKPVPAKKCPPLCTKLMPEFQGKQQKLHSFFFKANSMTGKLPVCTGQKEDEVKTHDKHERDSGLDSSDSTCCTSGDKSEVVSTEPPSDSSSLVSSSSSSKKGTAQAGSLKRTLSDKTSDATNLKKVKKGNKVGNGAGASTMGGKQASLLNFFHKPPPASSSMSANSSTSREQDSPQSTVSEYWQKDSGKGDAPTSPSSKSFRDKDSLKESEISASPSETPFALQTLTLIPGQTETSDSVSTVVKGEDSASHAVLMDEDPTSQSVTTTSKDLIETPAEKVPLATPSKSRGKSAWKGLLSGLPPPPPCKGHKEPCVLRTVKKKGPNKGKQFYVCARPQGLASNKESRCDHFQWVTNLSSGKKSDK